MTKHQGKGIRLVEVEFLHPVPPPEHSVRRKTHYSEAAGYAMDLVDGFVVLSKGGHRRHVPFHQVSWCLRPKRGRMPKDSPYRQEGLSSPEPVEALPPEEPTNEHSRTERH